MLIEALGQIFGLFKESKSLLEETISVIQTFQRMAATKIFRSKVSESSIQLFSWAYNLIEVIKSQFTPIEQMSNVDNFVLYSMAWTLFQLFFVINTCRGVSGSFVNVPGAAALALIGAGISFNFMIFVYVGIGVLAAGGLVYALGKCESKLIFFFMIFGFPGFFLIISMTNATVLPHITPIQVFSSVIMGLFIFHIIAAPIYSVKTNLTIVACICYAIIIVLSVIINVVAYCKDNILFVAKKMLNLVISISTFPFATKVCLILGGHESIAEDYKSKNWRWFELASTAHQIVYAVVGGFDIPIGCLVIECVWVVVLGICRPHSAVSDNVKDIIEAFVLIASNSLTIGYENSDPNITFSKNVLYLLFVIACLPVIGYMYTFFVFDFMSEEKDIIDGKNEGENEDNQLDDEELNNEDITVVAGQYDPEGNDSKEEEEKIKIEEDPDGVKTLKLYSILCTVALPDCGILLRFGC
ncbi:uncharacterized protein GO595_000228 [Histomonas meleagridis]|uniref:uncharacterized protein n=1 Tax=Histomonas meleagridis TaxID=135588 RepID=UPI00355A607A|nr:hypothetical protein GO595_000228 [Histomonas meleagridis]